MEQIPYGVLLCGAYRAVISNADRTAPERQAPEGSGPGIVNSASVKENFSTGRATGPSLCDRAFNALMVLTGMPEPRNMRGRTPLAVFKSGLPKEKRSRVKPAAKAA